jgi:hypothetical protein
MTGALTLTEAAERLSPVFDEQESSSAVEKSSKGKWLTLESAGEVLAERFSGQRVAPKRKAAAVTIDQAAKQIEAPYVDLADLREKREMATVRHLQCLVELHDFSERAVQLFQGTDSATLAASPDFQAACAYEQQLRGVYEAARQEEQGAWDRECKAENDVFEAGRPDWSPADAKKVAALLFRLGLSEKEMYDLWLTPQPIDVTSPICMILAQMVVAGDPEPVHAALTEVGFGPVEISAVMSGERTILMRDHRIQELVARAADADTPAEDRAAA